MENEMKEFIEALKSIGATNIDIDTQREMENNDQLIFELNGKIFQITSGRGGDILQGSYLRFYAMDEKDLNRVKQELRL
jgi:hypothetical protein